MDGPAPGDQRTLRVGSNGSTYLLLVSGVVLLLLIPLVLLLTPPSPSVIPGDAVCRVLGVFGALMILVGIRRRSVVLELTGTSLRYRRLFGAQEIDVREATHIVETFATIRRYRSGPSLVYNLHLCRIQNSSDEIFSWIRRSQDGGLVFSDLDFIRNFESAAAMKGVKVLMTVDAYSCSKSDVPFFKDSDIAVLLAELRRVSPALSVDPFISKRLGATDSNNEQGT
jgi:hypothetical protein